MKANEYTKVNEYMKANERVCKCRSLGCHNKLSSVCVGFLLAVAAPHPRTDCVLPEPGYRLTTAKNASRREQAMGQ